MLLWGRGPRGSSNVKGEKLKARGQEGICPGVNSRKKMEKSKRLKGSYSEVKELFRFCYLIPRNADPRNKKENGG